MDPMIAFEKALTAWGVRKTEIEPGRFKLVTADGRELRAQWSQDAANTVAALLTGDPLTEVMGTSLREVFTALCVQPKTDG